jgi:MIP family channel proteins
MTTVGYQTPGSTAIGIALTFGFTIFVLCFAIGHISGGFINCVVTLSFVLLKKISIKRGIIYFVMQFFGMLVGAGFLKAVTPSAWWNSCFASNFVAANATAAHAFWIEFFLTGILMLVICAASDEAKSNQVLVPLAIGVTITCCHMVGIPLTGTSLNPTRSFASAAAASGVPGCEKAWDYHIIFWAAPLLGGVAASFLYEYVFLDGGRKIDSLIAMYRNKIN